MKIGFATADWSRILGPDGKPTYGGSGWARIGLPARHLRAMGLDVVEGTLVWSAEAGVFLVRQWPGYDLDAQDPTLYALPDLIVLQRWMFASVAVETRTAQANGQVVVNDLDDHFWGLDPRNRAAQITDPRRNPVENRDHYAATIRASSAVTVATPYLADVVKRMGVASSKIHVLENHLDTEAFYNVSEENRHRQAMGITEFRSKTVPKVGWVGATPWRSGDLETMRGILGPFLDRHGLRAYHGGHLEKMESFRDLTGITGPIDTRPMAPIERYPSLFEGLDVGIVPLRDVPFNRAKSWIKGTEYAAAGVPFVAQDLPEYQRLLARHGIGRVAKRPKDWDRHLRSFLKPEDRLEEIVANRQAVKALDIREGIHQWRDLYLGLLADL